MNDIPLPVKDQHAAVAGGVEADISIPVPEQEENDVYVSQLSSVLVVSLDLTSRNIFSGTIDFESVTFEADSYNVYSPFYSSKEDQSKPKGVARRAVSKAISILDTLNTSVSQVLGTASQIEENLNLVLKKFVREVEEALPAAQEEMIVEVVLPPEDDLDTEESILEISMKDIVKVSGWLNAGDADGSGFRPYTLVLSLTVNSGAFYDTEDPHNYVRDVLSLLRKAREKKNATVVVQGIILNGSDLMEQKVQDMLMMIAGDHTKYKYMSFGHYHLATDSDPNNDWAPQSKQLVEKELLNTGGDAYLMKVLK